MKLVPVFLDFETYWSATHSLTNMSPIVYVQHPKTEIISCAIKIGVGPTTVWVGEKKIRIALSAIEWSSAYAIGHNMSGFDSMILAWRLGITPAMWGCTLAMSRPQHGMTVGGSLAKLVKHYELGVKDNAVLLQTKGKHLKDFTTQELEDMRTYNADDTDMCAGLFWKLLPNVPKPELRIIDMTTRMLVEPKFKVDKELLLTTLGQEKARKKSSLLKLAKMLGNDDSGLTEAQAAEAVRTELASSVKFAALLTEWGVEIPLKPSPADPEKQTYAFARTDPAYLALQNHSNPLVATAASARMDVKSTILETRIESFLNVSDAMGGRMPIAKNYYAAHTGRFGGSMGLNQENLPRIDPNNPKPSDALRKSLRAPKRHKVVVADLSGIELRINHFLWKAPSSMSLFQLDPGGADLYKDFAAKLYDVPMNEVTKPQRQVGKIAHLGLGFGSGPKTFQSVAKTMGGVDLTSEQSNSVVQKWRAEYKEIRAGWYSCHNALDDIFMGTTTYIDPWQMCYTCRDGIQTPVGVIRYPDLRQDDTGEWSYGEGRNLSRIYAGKITENIVQHLARFILTEQALEIYKVTGARPVHTVHDELVYIIPDGRAADHLAAVHTVMRTPPAWWPELVTWSSGDIADTYGDAK